MTNKSRIQNKKHDCGHVGLGQFCHLCKQLKDGLLVQTIQDKFLRPEMVNPSDIKKVEIYKFSR